MLCFKRYKSYFKEARERIFGDMSFFNIIFLTEHIHVHPRWSLFTSLAQYHLRVVNNLRFEVDFLEIEPRFLFVICVVDDMGSLDNPKRTSSFSMVPSSFDVTCSRLSFRSFISSMILSETIGVFWALDSEKILKNEGVLCFDGLYVSCRDIDGAFPKERAMLYRNNIRVMMILNGAFYPNGAFPVVNVSLASLTFS